MRKVAWLLVACAAACADRETTLAPDAAVPSPDAGVAPPPSAGHELVYHAALERVLLVNAGLGGVSSPPRDTPARLWAWDGARWTLLDDAGPPIRNLGGVAYDARRDVLVLHGGTYSASVSYGDTWEWTPAGGWTRRDVPGPGVRDHTQMAYDAARERVVLFGGQASLTEFPADTWTWDGASWTRAAVAGPGARVHHAMAYDPSTQRVVLFGGNDPADGDRGETWSWDGATWTELPPAVAPRTHGRMAHDASLGALVFVGGLTPGERILVRDSNGWSPLTATGAPGARYLPGVAYDERRRVLVVYGGGDPSSSGLFADTWELDAGAWSRRAPP